MFRRRLDIPLDGDPSSRFLPWIVALTVFVGALALAGALALGDAVARWDSGLTGTLTVEIPLVSGNDSSARRRAAAAEQGEAAADRQVEAALKILRATAGVARAEPLGDEKVAALLIPWLGRDNIVEDLPLPRLIDVKLAPGRHIDLASLREKMKSAAPDAVIDDHGTWFRDLIAAARSVEALAIVVFLLVEAASVAVVVFATRTSLAVHRDAIEVLHLIGARDSYVARQFQTHALKLGLKGALAGVALAAAAALLLTHTAGRIEAPLFPAFRLDAAQWAGMAGLVPVSGLITMAAARITVMRLLRGMP